VKFHFGYTLALLSARVAKQLFSTLKDVLDVPFCDGLVVIGYGQ
jgi:hypothetical protein